MIELLVVLGVVAVLAALLFIGYTRVMKQAQQAQCVNNLRSLATASLAFASDNDGILPHMSHERDDRGRFTGQNMQWDYQILPYLDLLDDRGRPIWQDGWGSRTRPTVFYCPAAEHIVPGRAGQSRSYVYNGVIANHSDFRHPDTGEQLVNGLGWANLSRLESPSAVWLIADMESEPGNNTGTFIGGGTNNLVYARLERIAYGRHGSNRANFAYADGSVRAQEPRNPDNDLRPQNSLTNPAEEFSR